VCSSCHPFYIGDESKKVLAGRLEKFKTRQGKAASKREESKKHATAQHAKKTVKREEDASSEK
jgi:hypothetical protein